MLDLNSIAIGVSPAFSISVEHPTGGEYAAHLRGVARFFEVPVQEKTSVLRVTKVGEDFRIDTAEATLRAKHVIWAAGEFQYPRLDGIHGSELCRHTATVPDYEKLEGDIVHPDGNLLMRFGFERYRDAAPNSHSTCYRLDQDQQHVALWGFGLFFGRRDLGGLYLGRFEFCPDWAPIESISLSIHWPDELPIFARPYGQDQWQRARKLWELLLLWIADYERWVVDTSGISYRTECVESWLRPFVSADSIVEAWQFLSVRGWEHADQPLQEKLKRYTLPRRSK